MTVSGQPVLHKQSSFPQPLNTIRKTKPFKQCARLQPAAQVPAAQAIILIHHGLKLLAIKHRAFARNQVHRPGRAA